jgi:hypothetical protein
MLDFQQERMSICESCDKFNQTIRVCTLCGCFMPLKTTFKLMACPDTPPKWDRISAN